MHWYFMILVSYFYFIVVLLGIAAVPKRSSNGAEAYHVRDQKLKNSYNTRIKTQPIP